MRLPHLFAWASVAVAVACVATPPARQLDVATPPVVPVERVQPLPDVWTLEGLVPVRLAAGEGRAALTVVVDGVRHRVARRAGGVSVDDGDTVPSAKFAGARLEFESLSYAGALFVAPDRDAGLHIENWVALEDYVAGVVASEIALWSAPRAFLEVQAIAARSYVVATLDRRRRTQRAFVEDGVIDQAYRGRYEPDAAARARGLDRNLADAVARTRGHVLVFGTRTVDARFHAACGGHTASGLEVFGPSAPPGETASCPGCRARPAWTCVLSASEIEQAATRLGLRSLGTPVPTRRDPTGRWLDVELRGPWGVHPVAAGELRRAIGWDRLTSTYILSWRPNPDGSVEVVGRGRGHGVGLCQEGARHFADAGYSANAILAHYYPGLRVGILAERSPPPSR